MPRASNRANRDIIREFLLVADLLEEPQLARLYSYLAREGEATVQEVKGDLELLEETAYTYVNRLVNADVIEVTHDKQPRRYVALKIKLTVTAAAGDRKYTITPALIDAVGRRQTDDDINTYVDRHGVDGLATALTYTVARERGEVTHRLIARDLDISPLAAESVLRALWPVVHQYFDIEDAGGSIADIEALGAAEDSVDLAEFHESTRTANNRFGVEDIDD
ncbi:transcriptional regulator TrmB (plasmid) [Haloterrigena turkmenica DSM 5511]|uniref:Transcriptional regulator TrmB n=1 Tax=Haloterrigena turkmenica (strain ATCC 51198 / DSM 5511 / JCM 9101 / NCIMB 13204 / VKM B-1734 / 4k) TaxID=543526 RepID=D2S1T7_HALTV|nr:transcriptional regulator TrmB [Haloterrigena turkmenica DSM 5511]